MKAGCYSAYPLDGSLHVIFMISNQAQNFKAIIIFSPQSSAHHGVGSLTPTLLRHYGVLLSFRIEELFRYFLSLFHQQVHLNTGGSRGGGGGAIPILDPPNK